MARRPGSGSVAPPATSPARAGVPPAMPPTDQPRCGATGPGREAAPEAGRTVATWVADVRTDGQACVTASTGTYHRIHRPSRTHSDTRCRPARRVNMMSDGQISLCIPVQKRKVTEKMQGGLLAALAAANITHASPRDGMGRERLRTRVWAPRERSRARELRRA